MPDMPGSKYGNYIVREPIYKGTYAPLLHICGEPHLCGDKPCPGSQFEGFPVEHTLMCITEPLELKARIHAHNYDQILYFMGSDPTNFFKFDAEVEITLGAENETHLIDASSVVYIPKGMLHCPIKFIRVDAPIMFMHLCIASTYARSQGETDSHPRSYERYTLEERQTL